eukprot:TRINITY_DN6065_c0_g1_i1.p1 TRINITY_DN6065_c0_g1~~TRINITY_DN6065_c0_g1_i1.p1  ORF type:complete len:204 (+),score=51.61 TRINITY_DN6065_c0_g1_i1:117-728(+)
MQRGLVGSEMCIRDRWYQRRVHGNLNFQTAYRDVHKSNVSSPNINNPAFRRHKYLRIKPVLSQHHLKKGKEKLQKIYLDAKSRKDYILWEQRRRNLLQPISAYQLQKIFNKYKEPEGISMRSLYYQLWELVNISALSTRKKKKKKKKKTPGLTPFFFKNSKKDKKKHLQKKRWRRAKKKKNTAQQNKQQRKQETNKTTPNKIS